MTDDNVTVTRVPGFPVGTVVATPGAMRLLTPEDMSRFLDRHVSGDWGDAVDIDEEDVQANRRALVYGGRLFSVYRKGAECVWVITEANRLCTTFLLPEEY